MGSRLLFCLALSTVWTWAIHAEVRLVPAQYSTVQAAIDAATDGDEIVISPGLYLENLQMGGRNVVLRSTDPADPYVVSQTIVDGSQAGPVVIFGGTETQSCMVAGLTIRNGSGVAGGGLHGEHCKAAILNNLITDNDGITDGGGIGFCDGLIAGNLIVGNRVSEIGGLGGGIVYCHGTIEGNVIVGNSAPNGAGIAVCRGVIRNNRIENNTAGGVGGGLDACNGVVEGNLILGNRARRGGGVHTGGAGRYVNNLIAGNTADEAGGGCYFVTTRYAFAFRNNTLAGNICSSTATSGVFMEPRATLSAVEMVNNIVWGGSPEGAQAAGNLALAYCLVEGWPGAVDPMFVAAELDDYRLLPGSPAIDAGSSVADVAMDADGRARPYGAGMDIGAYEYQGDAPTPRATPTPLFASTPTPTPPMPGDVNGDGRIDDRDVFMLAEQWQAAEAPSKADLDNDGAVDATDLLLLIEAMLR